MKALIIGSGGREHAIARELELSSGMEKVFVSPGRDAFDSESIESVELDLDNTAALLTWIRESEISYVVVGPEDPLVKGIADLLRENDIPVVGPGRAGAMLEGSKVFSKEFMKRAQVPTADFEVVKSWSDIEAVVEKFTPPYVLKADGLAAGKGVSINDTIEDLKASAKKLFEDKVFGEAGSVAVLEQFQPGWELSYIGITNGTEFSALPLSQDHKRLLDGDRGPNTGGMGVAGPLSIDEKLRNEIQDKIVHRTLKGLNDQDIPYRGVLYIGLMITENGPQVIEYNVRFGDPETQIILPLTDTDWNETFFALAKGKVAHLKQKDQKACCVVLASEGYPESPKKGTPIESSLEPVGESHYYLHAGTKKQSGGWLTAGGRVLNSVAMASTIQDAIGLAYKGAEEAAWDGCQIRRDIGKKLL